MRSDFMELTLSSPQCRGLGVPDQRPGAAQNWTGPTAHCPCKTVKSCWVSLCTTPLVQLGQAAIYGCICASATYDIKSILTSQFRPCLTKFGGTAQIQIIEDVNDVHSSPPQTKRNFSVKLGFKYHPLTHTCNSCTRRPEQFFKSRT